MTKEQKGIIAIIVFEILMGVSPILQKLVSPAFPGSLLTFARYIIASLFLFLLILSQKKQRETFKRISRKQWQGLILLGATSSGIASILYIFAVRTIGASLTVIISNLEVPIGIALAILFLNEKLTKNFIILGTVILLGFFLLTAKFDTTVSANHVFFIGILAAFVCAIIFGASTVLGKVLLQKEIPGTIVTLFRHFFGAVFGILFALFTVPSVITPFLHLTVLDWVYITTLAIPLSGLGFLLYYYALHQVAVKKISLFFVLAPVIGTLLGIALGERLTILQWVGAITILSCITILIKAKENIPAPQEVED